MQTGHIFWVMKYERMRFLKLATLIRVGAYFDEDILKQLSVEQTHKFQYIALLTSEDLP